MAYRWVDHTAEVELKIEAATEVGVFEEALRLPCHRFWDSRLFGSFSFLDDKEYR